MIAFALTLLLSAAGAMADDAPLPSALYAALQERFARPDPLYSQDLLADIAQRSGIAADQLRPQITVLLDTLEAQRKSETDTWAALLLQGSPDLTPERTSKLIGYLVKESRKVLANDNKVLLEKGVKKAARKAKVPFFQSRAYVLKALEWAQVISGESQEQEIRPFGFLVGGQTNRFEVALDPLLLFFDTDDEAFVREQVREIQRFIIPAMVRRLPESAAILWAVRERESNALVLPDYHLRVGIDNFSFSGSNFDLKPCIETTIDLVHWESKVQLMQESFSFCGEKNGSATTRELAPFWNEAADAIREHTLVRLGR
ncbi:MAG: hypothetical protein VX293_11885 [Candidatus Latescibacterota bacterium]|nr:hypothetical protein [Candidatus Latescibacterota bacterium]